MYELLQSLENGEKNPKVQGIYYKREGELIGIKPREPFVDVDRLPFMDYGMEGHYIRKGNRIVPVTENLLMRNMGFWYTSFFTYGCPFNCSYCCNSFFHKMSTGYSKIRKHSPEYIVDEIKYVKRNLPFVKMVKFNDDCFLSLNEDEITRFMNLKAGVGDFPFVATGMNPSLVTEQKIALLVEAGLKRARIGIQSGSPKTMKDIFTMKLVVEDIIKCSEIFLRHSDKLVPTSYDIILDNPWENPQDILDTYNLVRNLRRPFVLNLFSLAFYPMTAIYEMAMNSDEVEIDEDSMNYAKNYAHWQGNLLNCLIAVEGVFRLPDFIRRRLLTENLINRNPTVPKVIRKTIHMLTISKKVYLHASKRDLTMLPFSISRLLV